MDLADKLELCKGHRAMTLMARLDGDEDLLNSLREMEFGKLLKMEKKYHFFKGLNKQSKLDNVISMMKIFESLEVELPNIKINTMDIDKTCDELWESINEQIPVSDNDYHNLISLMKDIVDDDDINHPNTKRKLNDVLRNLGIGTPTHNPSEFGHWRIIRGNDDEGLYNLRNHIEDYLRPLYNVDWGITRDNDDPYFYEYD